MFSVGIILILLNHLLIIKYSKESLKDEKYGVIDGRITKLYNDFKYFNNRVVNEKEETHGDYMCKFIYNLYKDYNIYYYNAELEGKITEDSIISGLEWMKEKGIRKVNISLSTKKYSDKLENWIKENNNLVTVFASYSNEKNTYDYPAMYKYVVGTTGIAGSPIKDNDIEYSSNYIIDMVNFEYYKGNSYLSLISMFQK